MVFFEPVDVFQLTEHSACGIYGAYETRTAEVFDALYQETPFLMLNNIELFMYSLGASLPGLWPFQLRGKFFLTIHSSFTISSRKSGSRNQSFPFELFLLGSQYPKLFLHNYWRFSTWDCRHDAPARSATPAVYSQIDSFDYRGIYYA